jgi:hypothetical protein
MPIKLLYLRRLLGLFALAALLTLTACAPENLDITPSPVPTETPAPTATRDAAATEESAPEAEATEASAEGIPPNRAAVDAIIAELPDTIEAGSLTWRRTEDAVAYTTRPTGQLGRVSYDEAGGGLTEITFGVFDTAEAAQEFYDFFAGTNQMEFAEPGEGFPEPNLFSLGTYTADGIMRFDNLYVRVSVPRFSGVGGDPLAPLAREVVRILEAQGIDISGEG